MKKKITAVLLAVTLCFTLCACNGSTGASGIFKGQVIINVINNP